MTPIATDVHSPKRILITGGAGFIGSNFVHYWMRKYPNTKIVVIDSLSYAGNLSNIESYQSADNFTFIKGDICDELLIEKLFSESIDTVVHFAAESHVDRSIIGADEFIRTNIVGTHTLLKYAKQFWLDSGKSIPHRFHHVSTDEVFGSLSENDMPSVEYSRFAPNSPYAASKASADHLVRAYHQTYGLDVTTSNCTNNYGPYQFPEKLIPLAITNIFDGKSLPIYGDGLQVRDWLHVDDHNRALDLIIRKGESGETYNVGSNNEMTNIDLVKLLCNYIDDSFASDLSLRARYPLAPFTYNKNAESLITYVDDRLGHDRRYSLNTDKIQKEIDFKPSINMNVGISSTIDWYINNEPWWRNIQNKMVKPLL